MKLLLDFSGMSDWGPMPASPLSAADLRNLIKLVEKRESLQAALAEVELDIHSKINGTSTPSIKGPKKPTRAKFGKKGRCGAVKEQVVTDLTQQ